MMTAVRMPCRSRCSRWTGLVAMIGVAAALVLSPLRAIAQPDAKADAKAAPKGGVPVAVFEHTGLASMMTDPRDATMANAFSMLPTRLKELSREIPELRQVPPQVIDLVLNLVSRPGRIAITFDDAQRQSESFGFGVVLSVLGKDQAEVGAMFGTINSLIVLAQLPAEVNASKAFEGMNEIVSPAGVIRYGPRQAKDGWRFEIHAGLSPDPDTVFAVLPKAPDGVTATMRGRLDLAPLTPFLDMMHDAAGGDPSADHVFGMIHSSGMFGENAAKLTYVSGFTKDRSIGYTRAEGMKRFAEKNKMGLETLTAAELNLVPGDALLASIAKFDFSMFTDMIDQFGAMDPEFGNALAEIKKATGVDLKTDVLAALGGTTALYLSDATGGSGLMSAIAVVSLKDRAKFEKANEKLAAFVNAAIAKPSQGYARGRSWADSEVAGAKFYSMTFPGLPIPLELTYALTEKYLIAGLSPQAVVAAVRQASGKGDEGLGALAGVKSALPSGKPVASLSYINSERTMRFGYQFVGMFGSAIGNAMRSPVDEAREPGMLVPIYTDLNKGVRPHVSFSYWDGDTFVTEMQGNRSLLVEACSALGAVEPFTPLLAVGVAAAAAASQRSGMPAFGEIGGMHQERIVAPVEAPPPGAKQPRPRF